LALIYCFGGLLVSFAFIFDAARTLNFSVYILFSLCSLVIAANSYRYLSGKKLEEGYEQLAIYKLFYRFSKTKKIVFEQNLASLSLLMFTLAYVFVTIVLFAAGSAFVGSYWLLLASLVIASGFTWHMRDKYGYTRTVYKS